MGEIELPPITPITPFQLEFGCIPVQQSMLKIEANVSKPISFQLDLPSAFVRDYKRLQHAWSMLARQNHALRTVIVKGIDATGKTIYRQRVLKEPATIKVGLFYDEDGPQGLEQPARLVLDWSDGAPTVHLLMLGLVADKTSLRHLSADLVSILNGGVPRLRLPYPEYVSQIAGRELTKAKRFWAETLDSPAHTALHSMLSERTNSYTETSGHHSAPISGPLLRSAARLHGTSIQSWVYTAFGVMLNRHSQTSGGTALFIVEGRDRTVMGHDSVIGLADLEYPLRLDLSSKLPAAQAVMHTERMDILSSSYSYIGYDSIKLHHGLADSDFKVTISSDGETIPPKTPQYGTFLARIHLHIGNEVTVSAVHDNCIPAGKMEVLLDHFTTALSSMIEKPDQLLGEMEVISPGELAFFMDIGRPLTSPVADNVHRLFEEQVTLTPFAPAAQFETDAPMTYDQLNRIANIVARQLPAARGSFVPVCVQRSLNLIISLVAILKTGAAYVTLDPETPQERNNFIVDDVDADFVIVDKTTAGRFPNEINIEDLTHHHSSHAKDTNLGRVCDPSDAVYVIYTSGTSGNPKGVLHTHTSATSGLDAFPTLPDLRQLLFHNPVFSAAQRSVWSTLKQGGCLCLASKENLTVHIGRTINQMQINVIDVTPSTALLIEPGTVPCLRRMTVAGELINPALIPMWVDKLELLNAYGLSENTQVNWRREMTLGQNPQNIGRPSDTTTAFVLQPGTTKLCPLLVPGELCLGGNQLAVRYLNRPEKTAEAFIKNPFGPGRLYRTGDMVIAHEDGSIEMVGRIDFQVKINGQRVEPGDSNTIIQTHSGVYTSSVVSADIQGRKVLVAVIIPKPGMQWARLRSELKILLKLHVPGYMIPTYWIPEKELPLNVNGKVDIPRLSKYVQGLGRDNLLEFSVNGKEGSDASDNDDVTGTLSPAAQKLRDIWAEILNLPSIRISASDFFQELGGSSLDAIRCAAKAHDIRLDVSAADILRLPLGDVTRPSRHKELQIDVTPFSLIPKSSKLDRKGLTDAYPTTSLQDAFLADSLLGKSTYVYRRYYRMQGDPQEFRHALESLAKWHPTLRSTFVTNKTSFLQVIRKTAEVSWVDLSITASEFSAMPKPILEPGENYVQFAALQDGVLAVTMHHALFDYWSNDFLLEDLMAVMRGQQPIPRPSFSTFVQSTRQQDQSEMSLFWKQKLEGATPSLLGHQTGENNVVEMEIAEDLQALTGAHKISPGSLIYAAWAFVVSLHTAQDNVVFGATLSGRDAAVDGILEMAGPTINTIPLRVQVDSDQSALDFARAIQDDIWDCSTQAQLGLRNILQASGAKADLYDTLVNVLIKEDKSSHGSSKDLLKPYPLNEPNYLDYTMLEAESDRTVTRFRLLSKLPDWRASLILGNVVEVIKSFVKGIDAPLGSINPASEQEVAYVDSLSAEQPTEPGLLAHTLIERMAARHPAKTALRDMNSHSMSYRDLDTAATNLASELRDRGVHSGQIIPLCMQKSISTLVAVLGVLKAGAAYTPLDPKNPRDRNEFIIGDVGAKVVITDSVHVDVLAAFTGDIINMDHLDALDASIRGTPPAHITSESLAYVIYTSGSTGLPKGVKVSHGAVGASTEGMIEACKVDQNWEALWFLNYVFDASYFDVFTVLGSGGTLCIAPQETLIEDLAGCVNQFKAKQLMITPSVSKLISPDGVPSLTTLLVCGEPIIPELASTWATRMDVYNGYGPTEATILMTVSKVVPESNLKSIGYPLKAVKASIVHPESMQPVPFGTVGELCVSGGQVAMGYLNRPDATASAFLELVNGAVLYRTGDYARWLPSGEIECLGRKDSQIKLNGYRIELGEIENAILANASDLVGACAVILATVQKKPAIVACYVPAEMKEMKEDEMAERETGQHLATKAIVDPVLVLGRLTSLAHYMVPKIFLPFWSFPSLPSGKTNRKMLKPLAEGLSSTDLAKYSGAPVAPSSHVNMSGEMTALEKVLRTAWAELFDIEVDTIGVADLFYHHGGDSIAAINLVSMLRRDNWALSVNDCLSYPSLREQATRMKPALQTKGPKAPIQFEVAESVHQQLRREGLEASDIEDIYPCAPGQVEFLTQGHTEDQFWQLMTVRKVPRDFDLGQWTDLTRQLTARNQILRAMYMRQDPVDPLSWVQIVLKEPVLDLSVVECATPEDRERLIREHWDQRFSVGKPFVRYLILRHPDGAMDICTKLDHAMYDGTLLRIFDDQFAALRDGTPMPKSVAFKDFVQYCAAPAEQARMLAFWKEHLAGSHDEQVSSSSSSYPAHLTHPKVGGALVGHIDLPVEAYAQKMGVTASIVFQAAYTLLLRKLTGGATADVTYDYLLTGRNVDLDDPQLINGTCANFLPFRARLDGYAAHTPVARLLQDTQNGFWQMTENGQVSLGDIYGALGVDRRRHAAKTLFLFQPFEPARGQQSPMRWIVMALSQVTMHVNYAVMFEVFKDTRGNKLKLQYDTRLFDQDRAKEVMAMYVSIVKDLVEREPATTGDLL